MKKMLLVFAHPDDESFAVGGSAAKYARAGWRVDLLCATRGEMKGRNLGEIRTRELTEAATILGISSIIFLDYPDGALTQQHYGEIEDRLFRLMVELQPNVVITFNTTGISNHPDHVKIAMAGTFAFQKYAGGKLEQTGKEDNAPKLYYVCMPESVVSFLRIKKVTPEMSFDKPWRGTPDKFVTTVIDISRFKKFKEKALKAHISQRKKVERFLSLPLHPGLKQEHFILRMIGTREVFMGKNDRIANGL